MTSVRKWIGAAVAGLLVVAAVPAPDGQEYEESSVDFNLRRSGCGSESGDKLFLSVDPGVGEEGSGCGTLGGVSAPLNEAFLQVEGEALWADSFSARDGVPVLLDGSRDVSGVLSYGQYRGAASNPVGLGVGQVTVDLTLKGRVDGRTKTLGTAVGEALVPPGAGDYEVPFTVELDDTWHGEQFTSVTLVVVFRGANVNQDFLHTEGRSRFTLPTLELVDVTTE